MFCLNIQFVSIPGVREVISLPCYMQLALYQLISHFTQIYSFMAIFTQPLFLYCHHACSCLSYKVIGILIENKTFIFSIIAFVYSSMKKILQVQNSCQHVVPFRNKTSMICLFSDVKCVFLKLTMSLIYAHICIIAQ